MGEKKELRNELALVKSNQQQLLDENEQLRQQINANENGAPFRMLTDPKQISLRAEIAQKLGIDPASYADGQITDDMILEAVRRLHNPHHDISHGDALMVEKNDTLAEAMAQNRKERSELDIGLTQARGTVQRLAGALQVSEWNKDGDEIVEKAQRFGIFAYWLKKRLGELAAPNAESLTRESRSEEIRTVLAALIGEEKLAKFIQNKPVKVSPTLLDLAENGAPKGNTYLDREFDMSDITILQKATEKFAVASGEVNDPRIDQVMLVFKRLSESAAAREEFLSIMNLVVLPLLRRQHPAYAVKGT
jgi:hypothetical protein